MAAILKRIEGGNVHVIDVDTNVHASRMTARTRLREIGSWQPSGGGTDLSLPLAYATDRGLVVDGFVLLTDGETWPGTTVPQPARPRPALAALKQQVKGQSLPIVNGRPAGDLR